MRFTPWGRRVLALALVLVWLILLALAALLGSIIDWALTASLGAVESKITGIVVLGIGLLCALDVHWQRRRGSAL